jgi:hypothetical protein
MNDLGLASCKTLDGPNSPRLASKFRTNKEEISFDEVHEDYEN